METFRNIPTNLSLLSADTNYINLTYALIGVPNVATETF
jgi:hypothetical protein